MLDKPLDDLIKEQKKNKPKKSKNFPKKSGPGGFKRDRDSRRSNFGRSTRGQDSGRFESRAKGGDRGRAKGDKGRKVRILNLNYNILESEVLELFESVGKVRFCKVLFDRQGRSLGKALVKYEYDIDHSKAIKEFNGAELDGRVLTVEYDSR